MFCAQCGTSLAQDARFCTTCGATVNAQGGQAPPPGWAPPGQGLPYASPGYGGPSAIGYAPPAWGAVGAGVQYAGFWIRFVASLVDGVVLNIATTPFSFLLGNAFDFTTYEDADGITQFDWNIDWGSVALVQTLSLAISIAYYVISLSKWGQTLGCKATGIKVVKGDGSLLSPVGAFVRWIGANISAIPFFLGYFWMLWDSKKQTWHDKMAGCYVVKADQ